MKFTPILNPLRHTKFSWLPPLAWALVKCAATAAPTTIEVFLHHRFGARSGRALLKGFLLLLVVFIVSRLGGSSPTIPLFEGFLFAYAIVAVGHWLTSWCRPIEQIHSYSTGEPWPLWHRAPVDIAKVEQYFEPALCCLTAWIVVFLDRALARWLFIAAIALFIKNQLLRSQLRTRQLDAIDNRFEAERLVPRTPRENETFVEARPAPPRPRSRTPGCY